MAQLPFKNNFCTRKKYLRSVYCLVLLKLCWGKDMDHEKIENLGNNKQTSTSDAAKLLKSKNQCNAMQLTENGLIGPGDQSQG